MALTEITVTGRYVRADGTPAAGHVEFRPSQAWQSPDDDTIVPTSSETVALDAAGELSVALWATDTVVPDGATYTVVERIDRQSRVYQVEVLSSSPAGTVDLADIAPVVDPVTTVTYALQATVDGHVAATTNVHGIADTSALVPMVVHHLNDVAARPDATSVLWVGSVQPANMATVDRWHDVAIRLTADGLTGATFTVHAAGWTGPTPLRWILDGTVYDVNTPSHVWATDGPHYVWMLYPDDPGQLTGDLRLQSNQLTSDLTEVLLPQHLTGTIELGGNQLTGDLALVSLPQQLTGDLYLYSTQLTGDLSLVSLPQQLTGDLQLYGTQLTGDLSLVSLPQQLTGRLYLFSNGFTGDLALVSWPPNITDGPLLSANQLHGNFDGSATLNTGRIWLHDNALTQAEVDAAIDSIYVARLNYTDAGPIDLNIAGTNATPSGIYQNADPPTTGKEKIYKLVENPDVEARPVWAITYTA